MREIITLECTQCKRRNYTMTKSKQRHPERVDYKKYCRFCRTHTPHKETR
ncbi:50S ribosomal protein L33 [candidate division TA06 bacterium]|nr:50S ribosomal protein L33 [candidate division TA06 bacterium]